MAYPIIEIAQGKLKGRVKKTIPKNLDYYSFKGIPYAKPPVGELRFAAPTAAEPWQGIRDATKDCNASPQYDMRTNSCIGSEDCLLLNVYSPKLPNSDTNLKLPVMVYIHGGGFVYGHGTDDNNNGPEYLMEKDVVIVAINYRLGIFGFLSLDCKEATGNMGLRDQVEALKWIKMNISKFSGDPDNVTIFGLSAGGASVEYLMLSQMAKGLFHKAISQGGSSLCSWAQTSKVKQLAYKTALVNGKTVETDQELLDYLKKLDTKELVIASMKALSSDEFRGGINFGFVPIVEKPKDWEPFLSESTYKLLRNGEFSKVPFMSGFATREGLLMFGLQPKKLQKVIEDKTFLQALPFNIDSTDEASVEKRIRTTYLETSTFKENDAFAIDFFTDVIILAGVSTATSLLAEHNSEHVYLYEFSYDGNLNKMKKMLNIQRDGACHGDELGYLMKFMTVNADPTIKDVVVRERLVTMWTDFAKFGNPTPKTDNLISTQWKPLTPGAKNMDCLVIDEKITMKNEVYPKRVALFREMFGKYPCSNLSF